MRVSNMRSPRTGHPVANQFIIDDSKKRQIYFQSYDSIIVLIDYKKNQTYLDETYWDYSVTTGKYRNQFLNECIAETRQKIKDGTYKLKDLNKR